jgi:hypothetical protein
MAAVLAAQPSSIGRVLDQGFWLFRTGLRGLVPYGAPLALVVIAQGMLMPDALVTISGLRAPAAEPSARELVGTTVGYVIAFVLHGPIIHRAGTLALVHERASGSWRTGLQRAPAMFGALLLAVLLGCVCAIPAVMIAGGLTTYFGSAAGGVLIVVFIVVLMGWLVVRFFFIVPEVVLRAARPMQALGNSWRLTRGNFWRLAALVTSVTIVDIALFVTTGTLLGGVAARLVHGSPFPHRADTLALLLTIALIRLISASLWACMVLATWHDLRMRAEGADLSAKIAALPPST